MWKTICRQNSISFQIIIKVINLTISLIDSSQNVREYDIANSASKIMFLVVNVIFLLCWYKQNNVSFGIRNYADRRHYDDFKFCAFRKTGFLVHVFRARINIGSIIICYLPVRPSFKIFRQGFFQLIFKALVYDVFHGVSDFQVCRATTCTFSSWIHKSFAKISQLVFQRMIRYIFSVIMICCPMQAVWSLLQRLLPVYRYNSLE